MELVEIRARFIVFMPAKINPPGAVTAAAQGAKSRDNLQQSLMKVSF
jgi:hypothetical protein